jgi:uncharacterized membrane protein required for colicin V production
MVDKALVILIAFDLFVFGVIILFGFTGYRRGGIKSFINLIFLYLSFIAAMVLYEKPSLYLQITLDTPSPLARLVCFAIFFAIFVVITRYVNYIITKILTTQVLIRGIISGIIGMFFGAIEGILLISIIFMSIAFYPVNPPLKDAISFKVMKDIPVELRDTSLWFLPNMQESLAQQESKLKENIKNKRDIMKEYETQ